LVWSAVVNGLLAPPLIVLILLVCNNPAAVGAQRNTRALNVLGGVTAVVMTGASLALIWSSIA
jgi:Mn2+/Fe2+ NRAMP family transporter